MASQAMGLRPTALTVYHSNSASKVRRIAGGTQSLRGLVRSRCSTSSASQASAPAAATGGPAEQTKNGAAPTKRSKDEKENRVEMISTIEEFDKTLRDAEDKLVVIEYAESHSVNSKRIYPAMVELSRTCPNVVFRLILADESEDTREIFRRAGVDKVPHFIFYKSMEVVHEEQGITEDMLLGDVLYYDGSGSSSVIEQLHSRDEVQAAIARHGAEGRLLVLDVGLKHCGPCVKVYPTVIKLARRLAGSVAFARMLGDENDDCMALLKEMNVIEVPTFLFIRDGQVQGRYVGSGKGELVGEILRHQGVKIT